MGMKINLIVYPITPMTANPIAHDEAIFKNSIVYEKGQRNKKKCQKI
jgi:hypothetical protein